MTTHYAIPLGCPNCGGEMDHVVSGRVIHSAGQVGTETRSTARCAECKVECVIEVFLRPIVGRHTTPAGCGSAAGYRQHLRIDNEPCGACIDAHARHQNPTGIHSGGLRAGPQWESDRIARRRATAALLEELVDA